MQFSKALQGYRISSLAEGFSQLTIRTYLSALNTLIDYIGDKQIEQITSNELRGFMSYLVTDYVPKRLNNPNNKTQLSTASHHRYWKAIRSFFRWAKEEMNIDRPDRTLKMPAWENKAIIPLAEDEIITLLRGCDYALVPAGKRKEYKIRKPHAIRNKAIILTLLDTGIRAGELSRLRICDVNLENGEVHVKPHHVKKSHSRTTFLGKKARKTLWKYLVNREIFRHDESLFVTSSDNPMTPQRFLNLLSRLGKSCGIRNVHPHRFRHTFAIQYLRNGGDIFTLQRILGHSSLEMVKRYLSIVKADCETAHRKASPVDNWRL